jgi:hypothetical protein
MARIPEAVKLIALKDGRRRAAGRVLVGVLMNHVRRILAPWLGQFFWYQAVQDLKLARSSPHYLLLRTLSWAWTDMALWVLWACAIPLARRALEARIQRLVYAGAGADEARRGGRGRLADVLTATYVAAALTRVEHAYARACWTGGQVYACWQLLNGDAAGRLFLAGLCREHWARMLVQLGFVLHWWLCRVAPLVERGLLRRSGRRLASVPAYGAVGAATAYVVRYSNRYFVLLEVSDMLVTFAWALWGVGLIAVEVLSGSGLDCRTGVREAEGRQRHQPAFLPTNAKDDNT